MKKIFFLLKLSKIRATDTNEVFFQIKQKNDENNDLLQESNKERTTKRVIAKQFSHPKKNNQE